MRATLGLPGGQLVANPIPEQAEIPREEIVPHIEAALAEAAAKGIAAKAVTPFLLDRIRNDLLARGVVLKDSAAGTTWERA